MSPPRVRAFVGPEPTRSVNSARTCDKAYRRLRFQLTSYLTATAVTSGLL